ncbi:amidohydrolase [Halorientalis pallida]|uniref:Amidohydrolase n=1 Tax=Halorientalis pallida TaxID=2479928 RepID=A0A498L5E7_9EURY|nr:amidohydrolase [Halorientalis pallida]RXK51904.1 amidohydrolase [Halorientalis pallida]
MTEAADRVFTNGTVRTLTGERAGAVAVRDGTVVRVGRASEVEFLVGVETDVVDLGGRVLLPGFVDAHTHLPMVGRYARHADLRDAADPECCIARLADAADAREAWILGFGYDESAWDGQYLTREDLDAVSDERPVAAFREDLHVASLNGVALDRLDLPADDVRADDGEPTGVVVEDAVRAVFSAVEPDPAGTRDLLLAGQERALELGITGVHDMVARPAVARAYRDLDRTGDLDLRVRLNYQRELLDAVETAGLATDHGSDRVRVGAIKAFADGSIGGRTAKLDEPYADAEPGDEGSADTTGRWDTDPEALAAFADRIDGQFQGAVHAIGDAAIVAVLDAFGGRDAAARHRIEHAELLTDGLVERLADSGLVVSVQPNFLKWAREGGLYESRLGRERARACDRFRDLLDAGATLAFGSDCMPIDPLFGIQQAVTAPAEGQRLSVTEAVRAYTEGAAYAGFDEDRLGRVEVGKRADFTVLSASPWDADDDAIADIDVAMTVVDGEISADGR